MDSETLQGIDIPISLPITDVQVDYTGTGPGSCSLSLKVPTFFAEGRGEGTGGPTGVGQRKGTYTLKTSGGVKLPGGEGFPDWYPRFSVLTLDNTREDGRVFHEPSRIVFHDTFGSPISVIGLSLDSRKPVGKVEGVFKFVVKLPGTQ